MVLAVAVLVTMIAVAVNVALVMLNVIAFGFVPVLVRIVIPLPALNSTVSKPLATKVDCPFTTQYLKVEFIPMNAFPLPRSLTSNPESVSNHSELMFVSVLV